MGDSNAFPHEMESQTFSWDMNRGIDWFFLKILINFLFLFKLTSNENFQYFFCWLENYETITMHTTLPKALQ
jgi:hypothetical protein